MTGKIEHLREAIVLQKNRNSYKMVRREKVLPKISGKCCTGSTYTVVGVPFAHGLSK